MDLCRRRRLAELKRAELTTQIAYLEAVLDWLRESGERSDAIEADVIGLITRLGRALGKDDVDLLRLAEQHFQDIHRPPSGLCPREAGEFVSGFGEGEGGC